MSKPIGVAVTGDTVAQALDGIRDLEQRGVPAAWLTMGGSGGTDPITTFAAAAVQTEQVKLGTSIIPTWPRHPVIAAQQALALAQLAPGRFRLGVGPSHQQSIEQAYGIPFHTPLTNLREYLVITTSLLRQGRVEFDGRHYRAHTTVPATAPDVPVMASALRPRSFELCGELADGAISWICPEHYLRDVALPAIRRGAQQAGRTPPPLVAHVPVCVHDDRLEAIAAARDQFGRYTRMPFYARMLEAAGFSEVEGRQWSDGMVEAVAVIGNERSVAERLDAMFRWGAGELLISIVAAGPDKTASRERALRFLGDYARSA